MVTQSLVDLVSLDGRHAAVTGAGSGIGRASAVALAQAGASVLALDVNEAGLAEIRSPEIDGVVVDVSDHAAVARALGTRPTDIVVNAAGIMAPVTLASTSLHDWERVLEVDLTGYFNVLKHAVPAMNRPGSIIQISSMMGHSGLAFPAYTAAKGAVLALTRQLAVELGPDGIRVNSVSPGMIRTGLTEDHLASGSQRDHVVGRTPLRTIGTPQDVAHAILYLAGDLSSFVTGTDILVDGGLVSALGL